MRKIFSLLFIIAAIFSFNTQSFSQPKLTLNVTGGYGAPLGDFTVDVPPTSPVIAANRADADFFPYYTKQYWNVGANGKLAIGQQGNWRVVAGFTYNSFTNSTNAIFKGDSSGALVVTSFEPKVNILSIVLGGEYAFLPKGQVNPFVGIAMPINFFSGDFTFGQSVYVKGEQRDAPMDMKSETRVGLTFDAGVDFMISKQVGIITGLNYNIINLIGKGADDEEEIGPNEIDLGDAEHTLDDGVTVSPSKTLTSINGYLGVSFFFGAPKPMMRK
jgi:opacity protein-like surface antigen